MARSVRPVELSGLCVISRGALALRARPSLCAEGARAAALVAEALAKELGAAFACKPRLVEAPAAAGGLPRGCCYVLLALGVDGRRALLELETGFAAALVDRLSGGGGGISAPSDLSCAEIAALSYLALHGLCSVRSVGPLERLLLPRLLCVEPGVGAARALLAKERSWIAVELDLRMGEVAGLGRLLLPASTVERIARAPASTRHKPLAPELSCATLTARLVGGSTALDSGDLAGLAPGDTVLLSELRHAPLGFVGRAALLFDHFHLTGSIEGSNFVLESVCDAFPSEALMHQGPPPVGSLPIEVHVELARLKIALGQLDQIRPGSVIGLGATVVDPVLLRVGDKAVARAELVDLEGELGVRILALLP